MSLPRLPNVILWTTGLPLETATHISDLVASNPAASDGLNNADDHMRLIKGVLLTDFAGVTQALTRTGNGLIPGDGTSGAPAYSFASEPTLGFYRDSAGVLGFAGGRLKNAAPVGAVNMYLAVPPNMGTGGTGSNYEYLELDGSTWPNASFPNLAAHLEIGRAHV